MGCKLDKLVSFLIFAFLSTSVSNVIAQEQVGTNFRDLTLEQALEIAKIENKRVFVDCYAMSCGPCIYMMENIFPLKEVGDYFNENFVSLKKDIEVGEGIDIAKEYNIRILPTYLIFESDGTLYCKIEGGAVRSPEDNFVEKFKNSIRSQEMSRVYKEGDYDDEFIGEYIAFLQQNNRKQLGSVLNDVVPKMEVNKLANPEVWNMVQNYLTNVDSDLFKHVFDNRDFLAESMGENFIQEKIISTMEEEFQMYKLMELDYNQRIKYLQLLEKENYPRSSALLNATIFRQTIKDKNISNIEYILKTVEEDIYDIKDDEQKITIISEMQGFEKIADPKQCRRAQKALRKIADSMSEENSAVVNSIASKIEK